jgi:AcrR family transcriptional regulator
LVKSTSPVGRPRMLDDETERGLLIDSGLQILERNGYSALSVGEVLAESGLSTRAFYRHFDSKEDLLEAFRLREAESVGRSLGRVVGAAPDPVAAVEAWLERFLDVFYQSRRAKRAALLSSMPTLASGPSAKTMREMRRISCGPLIDALRAGHQTGVLYAPNPEVDAFSIHALVMAARVGTQDREATRAHVMRYAWPALGLAGQPLSAQRSRKSPPK